MAKMPLVVALMLLPLYVLGVKGYVPPPTPVASSPSQNAELPVMVVQNEAHVLPVTPLKVRFPETI